MKLSIPFITKNQEGAYYLALLLAENETTAVLLQETKGKIKIITTHSESLSSPLEKLTTDQLIDVLDKTISRAEEVLPPHIETHKTVFGVKEEWVDSETKKITKDYLTKLKKICDSLDLTPIGFMVTTEAIAHLLQREEGSPSSAILAEIGKQTVTITILRGGKLIETLSGPLEEHTPTTVVDKLLRHVTLSVLPERIILSDGKITQHQASQFIAHNWTKDLPFLHTPQVTVLPSGFAEKAIAFGAAEQMGFEMSDLETNLDKNFSPEREEPVLPEREGSEVSKEDTTAEELGFVVNKDIADQEPTVAEEPKPAIHHIKHAQEESSTLPHHVLHHESDNLKEQVERHHPEKKHGLSLPKLTSLAAFKNSLRNASFGKNKKALKIGGILAAVLLIIGGLISFYLFQTQAAVILTLTPKTDDQTKTVTFSTTAPSDFSENIIAAKSITVSVDGSLTKDATGKKDVGEKAKGAITIYNNGEDEARLTSGTEVKASNGLVFVLEKDVKVASASGDIFSGTKPGTQDVSVVAKEIGSDYNMPSGTKFAVGGNIAAKNDSAFSGGSKKSVVVVSKNDLAKLRADLPKTLEHKAKEEIAQKASGEETILPTLILVGTQKEVFDKKVDEEAKKVKIAAIVTFAGIAYPNDELLAYAKSVIKNETDQQEMSFADDTIKAEVENAKQKNAKEVTATVAMQAGLLPKIDKEDIIKSIRQESVSDAKIKLRALPQIAKSDITFSPAIPFFSDLLPRLPNQIKVEVKSEE